MSKVLHQKINNPKKPRSEEMKGVPMVELFDFQTGIKFNYPKEQHEKFMKSNEKLKKKNTFSEYAKRYYVVSDFPGAEYPGLFHVKTGKHLSISTALFEEIKRRNPSNLNIKTKKVVDGKEIEEVFDPVKAYIITADDAIAADRAVKAKKTASLSVTDKLEAENKELKDRLAALEKAVLGGKSKKEAVHEETETTEEAPKEGRLKRVKAE